MNKNNNGFVKLNRNSWSYYKMICDRPSAFILLSLIAIRARRAYLEGAYELDIGEAMIGDYEVYGATPSIYRTDVKYLNKYGFIETTRTNRRGTIVKLLDTDIFDICPQELEQELTTNKRINNTRENKYTQENITGDISPGNLISPEIDNRDNKGGKE